MERGKGGKGTGNGVSGTWEGSSKGGGVPLPLLRSVRLSKIMPHTRLPSSQMIREHYTKMPRLFIIIPFEYDFIL